MGRMAPSLTSLDCVRLQRYVTLPGILGGAVAPNPRFWPYLVRRQSAAAANRFFLGLRKKYGTRAWSWFPFGSTLLVLDSAGIETVLASPENFADPFIKRLQLSAFTPQGAIVSRPPVWEERRKLNDHALAFGHSRHPDVTPFFSIIDEEVERMLEARPEVLVWDDFRTLAARISQQVIFGRGQYSEELARQLGRLVSASNWGIIRRPADFLALHEHIDAQVNRSGHLRGVGSLVDRAVSWMATVKATTDVEASSQIAFWLFVVKDALELHTVRTLALIASAPDSVRQQLASERGSQALTAPAIGTLGLLEACIKEGLRLWTPVPVLLRVALTNIELPDNVHIEGGQKILMHTGSYHRDPDVFGAAADRFLPEQRMIMATQGCRSVTKPTPPLYVFSRHQQSCAGQFLIIFLLKAVLASLLFKTNGVLESRQIATDPVPAAIDHFALRFWRQ